ncbi:hypothetical protein [Daejeonella sp.]|uniref:hypothetical protein n=1 Tax=Daejeonella sp. TaxID=2805397 RepID=UPI0030BDEA38
MEFEIDSDTLKDLEIFSGRSGGDGISQLFQSTRTLGGRDLLQKIMREPLSDIDSLNERLEMIRHFRDNAIALELNYSQVDLVEHYLKTNKRFLRNNPIDALYDHLSNKINIKPNYYVVREGINNIIRVIIDELFRGTNPKDAVEASLLIIRAMINIPNCVFLISTHHTELAADVGINPRVYF